MRAFFGVLAALLLVGVLIGIGTAIYNQGVTAGLTAAAASGEAVAVDRFADPYIHGPIGFGVSQLVALLFSVLLIVIIVGLARVAFGGGLHGPRGPGGWGDRRDRIEEWHRELPSARGRRWRAASGGRMTAATMPAPWPRS
ncbi:MAG: hypothetical protein ACRDGV_06690 [Candidatus Limnocylindria bacterium]